MRTCVAVAITVCAVLCASPAIAQDAMLSNEEHSPPPPRESEPPPAPEEPFAPEVPAPVFGAPGQLVVSGGSTIGLSYTGYDGSRASSLAVVFSPGVDFFLWRNVSLGVDANLSYSDRQGYGPDGSVLESAVTVASLGARLGVNLPLSRTLSFYPRLTVGAESIHRDLRFVDGVIFSTRTFAPPPEMTTRAGPWTAVSAPLLFHPVPHFFVGAGPRFAHVFAPAQDGFDAGGAATSLGATLVVGGHWGGVIEETPVAPSPSPELAGRAHRFGDAHQLVLSNEIGGRATWTTQHGTASSFTALGVAPAIDYFVFARLSIGVGAALSYGATTDTDPATKRVVDESVTSISLGPRLGYDFPIGPWLSFYPRASVALGTDNFTRSGRGDTDVRWIAVGLYAPLLLHPAPHMFLGMGPTFSHDVERNATSPGSAQDGVDFRGTSAGLAFVVGGWL